MPPLLGRLREVSDAWLREKSAGEKRFSLGSFDPDYLAKSPVAVVRQGSEIIAFANVLAGAEHEELTVDLMRYVEAAPRGVMDYLFFNLMLWAASDGYRWFGMGMAPLAGLEDRPGSSIWNRVGLLVYRHGEHFYNFRGLRAYKEKFEPVWRPRFLAAPPGLALPSVLTNVTTLIAGGMRSVVRR